MNTIKHDITGRDDIAHLVNTFYAAVQTDPLIGPVFNDRISDWAPHLQTMQNFWYTLLFGKAAYHGNPQQKHAALPIDKTHFDRWISLFSEITDELFEGEKATAAKEKAVKMSLLFQARLQLYQAQKKNRP